VTLAASEYLSLLRSDGAELGRAAARALDGPVAACPGWDGADLVRHVSVLHHWVAVVVRTRAVERPHRDGPPESAAGAGLVPWYEAGLQELVTALAEVDPEERVWSWGDPAHRSFFWFRRMAQETAVHRWDAQAITSAPAPIGPALAVDGIDEMLDLFLPMAASDGRGPDIGGSLHIHATDIEGEWTLRPGQDGLQVERGHGKGDAAVRGSASDLLLFLWGRVPATSLEAFGDPAILQRWTEAVRI
jgi:uncharacterized protein (TIGR03083 family)